MTTDAMLNLVLYQPSKDGCFEGATAADLTKLATRRPSVVLAFAPKAAGTFLRSAVVFAVNGQLVRTVHAQGGRDAQFYLPLFIDYFSGGVTPSTLVTHVHMQALPGNRNLITALHLKPIIMLRSVPDMLVSFLDMLATDKQAQKEGLNCAVPADFDQLDAAARADFAVDMIAPWYASYYTTWYDFAVADKDRVHVVRYNEFVADPPLVLQAMLRHAGIPLPRARCEAALHAAWERRGTLRYNKGVAGRGETYFSPAQRERIHQLLSRYKSLQPWLADIW